MHFFLNHLTRPSVNVTTSFHSSCECGAFICIFGDSNPLGTQFYLPYPDPKKLRYSSNCLFDLSFNSELRHARTNLLEVIANPNNEISTLTSSVNTYFSLLHGFLLSLDDTRPTEDSKLRNIIRFRWTDTLCGYSPTYVQRIPSEEIKLKYFS